MASAAGFSDDVGALERPQDHRDVSACQITASETAVSDQGDRDVNAASEDERFRMPVEKACYG
jgi:hypothetical protein